MVIRVRSWEGFRFLGLKGGYRKWHNGWFIHSVTHPEA